MKEGQFYLIRGVAFRGSDLSGEEKNETLDSDKVCNFCFGGGEREEDVVSNNIFNVDLGFVLNPLVGF